MNKIYIACLFPLLLPLCIFGQAVTSSDCNKVKYGTFYFYPANTQNEFIVIRKKSLQKEINLKTSDTSFWKINWMNDCEFNLKFIRKNRPIFNEEKDFYNAHVSIVKIIKITKGYYVFKAALDSVNNKSAIIDTVWFKAR